MCQVFAHRVTYYLNTVLIVFKMSVEKVYFDFGTVYYLVCQSDYVIVNLEPESFRPGDEGVGDIGHVCWESFYHVLYHQ